MLHDGSWPDNTVALAPPKSRTQHAIPKRIATRLKKQGTVFIKPSPSKRKTICDQSGADLILDARHRTFRGTVRASYDTLRILLGKSVSKVEQELALLQKSAHGRVSHSLRLSEQFRMGSGPLLCRDRDLSPIHVLDGLEGESRSIDLF